MFGKPRWNVSNFKALSRSTDMNKLPSNLVGKAWDAAVWKEYYEKAEHDAKVKHPTTSWRDPTTAGFRMMVSRSTRDYLANKKTLQVNPETDSVETLSPPANLTRGMIRRDEVDILSREPHYKQTEVYVVNMDCLELTYQAQQIYPGRRVACINMANINRPGGGWQNGKNAQEETLFMRTALSLELTKTEYPLGTFTTVLCRDVAVIRGGIKEGFPFYKPDKVWHTNFVTVTGIDLNPKGPGKKPLSFTDELILKTRAKIESMFALCANAKMDVLVLSALGCGAFRNPPDIVANIFKAVIEQYAGYFEHIYFGIVGPYNSLNLISFARTLVNPSIGAIQPTEDIQEQGISSCAYARHSPSIPAPMDITLQICNKGGSCTNESPAHFAKYTHPPPCPFGPACGRRDHIHRLMFFHYAQPVPTSAASSSSSSSSSNAVSGNVGQQQPQPAGSQIPQQQQQQPQPPSSVSAVPPPLQERGKKDEGQDMQQQGQDDGAQALRMPPRAKPEAGQPGIDVQLQQQQQQMIPGIQGGGIPPAMGNRAYGVQIVEKAPGGMGSPQPQVINLPQSTLHAQQPMLSQFSAPPYQSQGQPSIAPIPLKRESMYANVQQQQQQQQQAPGVPTVAGVPQISVAVGVPTIPAQQTPPQIPTISGPPHIVMNVPSNTVNIQRDIYNTPAGVPSQHPQLAATALPTITGAPVMLTSTMPAQQNVPVMLTSTMPAQQNVPVMLTSTMPAQQNVSIALTTTMPVQQPLAATAAPSVQGERAVPQFPPTMGVVPAAQSQDSQQPGEPEPAKPSAAPLQFLSKIPEDGFRYNATDVLSKEMAMYYQSSSWAGDLRQSDISLQIPIKTLFGQEAAENYAQVVENYEDEFENMRGCSEIPTYMGSALSLLAKDTTLIPKLNSMVVSAGATNPVVGTFTKAFSAAVSGLPLLVGDSVYCFAIGKGKIFEMCTVGSTFYFNGFVRANMGMNFMNSKISPSVKEYSVVLNVVSKKLRELLSFSMTPGEVLIPPGLKFVVKDVNMQANWIKLVDVTPN